MKVYILFIIGFLSLAIITKAQDIDQKNFFTIKEVIKEKQSLKGYVSLLCDSMGQLSIEQVSSPTYDTLFKKENEWDTLFVVNPKTAFWIKITLQNTTEENRWRIGLVGAYDNIAYYSPDGGIHFYKGISSLNYKPSERHLPYHPVSVPIFLTKRKQDIYIRTSFQYDKKATIFKESLKQFLDRAYIIPEKQLEIAHTTESNFDVAFFGICICMLVYNLFIYLFVRDKSYLYYSLAIVGVTGQFIFKDGYYVSLIFDFEGAKWTFHLNNDISSFAADISLFFFLSFSQVFLFAKQKKAKWHKILGYLKWYILIANAMLKCLELTNIFAYEISQLFHNIHYSFAIIILVFLCIYLWRDKNAVRLYYVYANLSFFILIIVYIAYIQLLLEHDINIFLLDNSFQIGMMLQIISFSVALAARINFMRQEIELKKLDNEQLNHRLLRTQMNPHFIFNSLTTIQNYLFENEPHKTAAYLAKFSKLMRQVLENSRQDFVSLEKEIHTLENYLQLQQMRFGEKLTYSIEISPLIDPGQIEIPPMFAQPFIENSIEHGLLHKAGEGLLQISFTLDNDVVVLEVKDNGVGLEKAKTLRSEVKKEHKSLATQITQERLTLLRQKHELPLDFMLRELKTQLDEVVGTQVRVELPYQN